MFDIIKRDQHFLNTSKFYYNNNMLNYVINEFESYVIVNEVMIYNVDIQDRK